MTATHIVHGDIYAPEHVTPDGYVQIKDGKIAAVGPMDALTRWPDDGTVMDARGSILAPGFIDLQINGAFGRDLTQEPTAVRDVSAFLPRTGVTAFCPTLITTTAGQYETAAGVAIEDCAGAQALGWHLEGPYLNPARAGAHDRSLLQVADSGVYPATLLEKTCLVTLAPELPGMGRWIERLRRAGIAVSAGHSDASYMEAMNAFDCGVRYVTHLFNAMKPYHQREPGLSGAALDNPGTVAGLIVDGLHLHPATVRLAWGAKGPQGIALVTDAMAAAGQPTGCYRLGTADVYVDVTEGSARLRDGTLAGSLLTMDVGLRRLIETTGCSLSEAFTVASTTPARVVRPAARKGRLATGYDADLVWLTPDLRVKMTMVAGQVVYDADVRPDNL